MSVYRKAASTDQIPMALASKDADPLDVFSHTLSDNELLHVFQLRAPFTYVRFSRLRLSIRIFNKATAELLVLLWEGRKGARSWIAALQSDILWLNSCDDDSDFSLRSWCLFVRNVPARARTHIRVCDGDGGRLLIVAKPALQLCVFLIPTRAFAAGHSLRGPPLMVTSSPFTSSMLQQVILAWRTTRPHVVCCTSVIASCCRRTYTGSTFAFSLQSSGAGRLQRKS